MLVQFVQKGGRGAGERFPKRGRRANGQVRSAKGGCQQKSRSQQVATGTTAFRSGVGLKFNFLQTASGAGCAGPECHYWVLQSPLPFCSRLSSLFSLTRDTVTAGAATPPAVSLSNLCPSVLLWWTFFCAAVSPRGHAEQGGETAREQWGRQGTRKGAWGHRRVGTEEATRHTEGSGEARTILPVRRFAWLTSRRNRKGQASSATPRIGATNSATRKPRTTTKLSASF
jgi:hypothetical protein